ncbi:MAG: 2-oxoglutarate dehydrogenase complex dihydrolipoyllysine-residue succinyltransferase [Pseudomonadota bacterium]|nr:2-oxoglutarate dehydrogenase complex dihydrolipoyllysine-residue succinyltransferase [Gammaproteobacteria bacterium]MDQ3581982.1 2-oxoglutarate dehydrogenase complex dihydrolipoyllysine-residue succinyltransferase [Pseudomonadota bacterium]
MLVEVKVPQLAESIADATLLAWRKRAGERVTRGEPLCDLETDKVTLEVSAPEDGVLKELRKQEGQTAVSHETLAVIDTTVLKAVADHPPPPAATPEPTPKAPSPVPAAPEPVSKLSPAVRKLVAEHAIDPQAVPASGKDGRLTKSDVLTYLKPAEETAPPNAPPVAEPVAQADEAGERRVPMTRLRRRIAERLLDAQHQHAILTTFNEVDMQPVTALRDRHRDAFEARHGVRLGFMSFFCKAAVAALKRYPIVNAAVEGEDIVYHDYYDLGIAVSSPRGLVVPVLRDVERLSFGAIETRLREYGEKAREAKLSVEELSGGTFTITNGGVFGSLLSTPILNPPQSAILGMHRIQDRPIAEGGQVVIRPMMYLALSYDHRIIDGREAVSFLVTLKQHLEDPARLLLDV